MNAGDVGEDDGEHGNSDDVQTKNQNPGNIITTCTRPVSIVRITVRSSRASCTLVS